MMTVAEMLLAVETATTAAELFRLHGRMTRGGLEATREEWMAVERVMTAKLWGGTVDATGVLPADGFLPYL